LAFRVSLRLTCGLPATSPWAGPVIVFADVRRRGDSIPGEALDITPRDVNTVVRLLETPTCACVADPGRYLGGEVVAGLRINDIRTEINVALGVDCVFESTLVPRSPVECADHVIAIALLLGLRWYVFLPSSIPLETFLAARRQSS
jgi:hypothetical protein